MTIAPVTPVRDLFIGQPAVELVDVSREIAVRGAGSVLFHMKSLRVSKNAVGALGLTLICRHRRELSTVVRCEATSRLRSSLPSCAAVHGGQVPSSLMPMGFDLATAVLRCGVSCETTRNGAGS